MARGTHIPFRLSSTGSISINGTGSSTVTVQMQRSSATVFLMQQLIAYTGTGRYSVSHM